MSNEAMFLRCYDGTAFTPIDVLHYLLFPTDSDNNPTDFYCHLPKPYRVPSSLRRLFGIDAITSSSTRWATAFEDSLVGFFVLCVVFTAVMAATHALWNRFDPHFRAVNPAHKKWYVVANLVKSAILGVFCTSWRFWATTYRAYVFDEWPDFELRRVMFLYVVTDLVALYMVPKLPRSTILHHVTSTALCVVASYGDFAQKGWYGNLGVGKMVIVYGHLSSVAYLVNAYLALRVLYSAENRFMTALRSLSLWSYIACCTLNWSTHVLWFVTGLWSWSLSWAAILYAVALTFVARDDLVLIRWLWRKSSPGAEK